MKSVKDMSREDLEESLTGLLLEIVRASGAKVDEDTLPEDVYYDPESGEIAIVGRKGTKGANAHPKFIAHDSEIGRTK